MKKVYKVMGNWVYSEDPSETEKLENPTAFDEVVKLDIFDRSPLPACVLRKGDKYGVYTLDHATGWTGDGTWCSPTSDAFPYDEVMFRPFPNEDLYGLLAFRIKDKWGIIKVADPVIDMEEGVYDVEYGGTKRRIVVPCRYKTLEDAEFQLGASYKWKNPFEKMKPQIKKTSTRNVKKGNGKDKIRVTFPEGVIIEESLVWKTLAEAIKKIGVKSVYKLKLPGIGKSNILLLDTHLTDNITYKDSQKEIEPGYYLLTYNNTEKKAQYLERISDELHLNLKIEIVSY